MAVWYVKLPPDSPEEIRRNLGCFWGGVAVFIIYLVLLVALKPVNEEARQQQEAKERDAEERLREYHRQNPPPYLKRAADRR